MVTACGRRLAYGCELLAVTGWRFLLLVVLAVLADVVLADVVRSQFSLDNDNDNDNDGEIDAGAAVAGASRTTR